MKRYFYHYQLNEVLDFVNEKKEEPISMRTLKRHIDKLVRAGLILMRNSPKGIIYIIKEPKHNGEEYVHLTENQIQELLGRPNKNTLKLFVALKKEFIGLETSTFLTFSRRYLTEAIGLSSKSKKTLDKTSEILKDLEQLGYIEIRKHGVNRLDYRIRSLEEYNSINSK